MYKLNLLKKFLLEKYPALAKYIKINYGLLKEEEDDRDYIMGASNNKVNWRVLKPDSNWIPEAKKMVDEIQKGRYLDTMGCTGYALNNVLEMIHLNKWNESANYSDRFLNKMSGTSTRGNSMRKVLETARKYGLVNEEDWTWDRSKFNWSAYYSPIPKKVKDKGKNWLKQFEFSYDSVWATKSMLKEALKYSPLYVGGYAWYRNGQFYYSVGNPNHCFTIISMDKMIAYDSYDPYIKNLAPNFKLYYVKRIYLEKKELEYNKTEIRKYLDKGVKRIMRVEKNGEVWEMSEDGIIYKSKEDYVTTRAKEDFTNGTMIPMNEKDFHNKIIK